MKPKILSDIDDINNSINDTNNRIANNEANYNANDVLAKIETIDGSGSGLDADLLDNKDSTFLVPTGTVLWYAGTTAPVGWLVQNGQAISRTTYSNLFSIIGTTYGSGDGSATFNLPDLVTGNRFIRASGGSLSVGTKQSDDFKSHNHTVGVQDPGSAGSENGFKPLAQSGQGKSPGTVTSNSTGGTETRPKNIAFLPIIKY